MKIRQRKRRLYDGRSWASWLTRQRPQLSGQDALLMRASMRLRRAAHVEAPRQTRRNSMRCESEAEKARAPALG